MGTERRTFELIELFDGIPVFAALVGLYAVAEVMEMAQNIRKKLRTMSFLYASPWPNVHGASLQAPDTF